jgi:hypothetical protein
MLKIIRDYNIEFNIVLQCVSLIVLVVTAIAVIFYWRETQKMKREMTRQNDLTFENMKISNMPILDLYWEVVRADPGFEQFQIQFAYDLFLVNKGSGPATQTVVQSFPSTQVSQAEVARAAPQSQLNPFSYNINLIGKDEKIKFHREHSDSYKTVQIVIYYKNIFSEYFKTVFEGNRDGYKLTSHGIIKNNK